ncbi:MAG: PQQ-dependent sugar dehydrogenase, partial [Chitinophagaceae bacterium]|nr:PQQ-dependent sugar dehydrogenase [Chitinophagaceae bacterium]
MKDKDSSQKIIDAAVSPAENRFTRKLIIDHLNEPLELVVTNTGAAIFIERTGAIKMFDPSSKAVSLVDTLPVNAVDGRGLLGMALDPDFDKNNFVYFFNTPRILPVRHQVSRYILKDGKLDRTSEKVLLKIPIDDEPSFHTGGSLDFDGRGNLYISVGDNTDPSQSDGFSPLDERKGRMVFDAQRSSSNTNDLRGKILRITPQADGIYTIPEGNLFPKNGLHGKPEIYIMGCRNPYRICVDKKTNILYWGEVGPDSGVDGPQGPKGYDEFNQAKEAGNYGWPYFEADNKAYHRYDFSTKAIGDTFDAARPVNESMYNTGEKYLPPVHKPMVWYPYDKSKEFEVMGSGGRTAMAGDIYHFSSAIPLGKKFPAYFDGAIFVFDWMRNSLFAIKLNEKNEYRSVERFFGSTKIDKPIDMKFAPDGSMYMLEYGENYGMNNADASLVILSFDPNNRPPVAALKANDSVGQVPLKIIFSGDKSYDLDEGDGISYQWTIDVEKVSSDSILEYTFKKPGVYKVILTVSDKSGQKTSFQKIIRAGNTAPQVMLESPQNRSFYIGDKVFSYHVVVNDKEDGAVDTGSVKVFSEFVSKGEEISPVLLGNLNVSPAVASYGGMDLISRNDCKNCHSIDKRTIGPSFMEISSRYSKDRPVATLAAKIIKGGAGVWGPHAMSAHPQLAQAEATEIVRYILDLSKAKQTTKQLSSRGSIPLDRAVDKNNPGKYLISAYYTDKGGNAAGPLATTLLTTLRYPVVQAEDNDSSLHMKQYPSSTGIGFYLGGIGDGSYLVLKNIDLYGITSLTYRISSLDKNGDFEVHLDSPRGVMVSKLSFEPTGDWDKWKELT